MTTEVIGRGAELDSIERWLGAPRPAGLLIEGEAGIGKTTLWRYALERAEAQGLRSLTCALAESEARLALAGLSDIVRPHLGEALSALARPQARALEEALLLRDAPEGLPDERAVAFGFLGLVTELARRAPLAIAVDDLQWLDASSLAVLRYSVRRLETEPVVLLFARRIEADRSEPEDVTSGFDGFERVEVGPFTLGALHRLLRMRLGQSLSRPVLTRLHAASGGNPLHALELARSLDREHPDYLGSLAAVMRARVASLPTETQVALALIAASSDPSVSFLSRASGESVLPALEPAVRADLVSIEADRVRFAHPTVASAAEEVVGDGATDVHRALAAVSESLEDRARHLGHATTAPDEEVAAALEKAAVETRTRGARSVAAELFGASARLTPDAHQDDYGRRALAAAQTFFEAGDTPRAEELLSELARELPDGTLRSEAHWRLGTVLDETGRWPEAITLWTDALQATDDPRLRAEIGRCLAITTVYTGTSSDAKRFAEDAVAAAEASGDRRQLSYALAASAFVGVVAGDEDFGPAIERALVLEDDLGESTLGEWSPRAVAAECARHTGDVVSAREHYAAVLERAVEHGDANVEQWAAFGLASVDLLAGDLARAGRLADVVVDIAEQTEVMRIPARMLRANVDAQLGRMDSARELLTIAARDAEAENESIHLYNVHAGHGLVSLCQGDAAAAAAHYGRAHRLATELGLGHATALRTFLYEAEAAAGAGIVEQADAALSAFERSAAERSLVWAALIRSRALAARRAADGDLDEAERLLEASLADDDGVMPLERGRTLLALGTIRRRARKRRSAREALHEALALFQELGAGSWAARVDAELAHTGGGEDATSGDLTPTEQRVARLVAEGKKNKEVAAELFVSVKTVEVTLTRVYRKLGIRSRSELARRAADLMQP